MPATIKIKNSSTASAVPTSSDLVQGELAVNVTDKRLFTENASGTVVELGTNPSILTLPDGSASAPTLTNDGDTNTGIFFPAADTVGITTGGTERARVDSSGNLGLGVTPSSWASNWKAIQTSTCASFGGNNDDKLTAIGNNFYNDGVSKYIGTGQAALYSQYQGQHRWYYSASGTAGNAITFTQAMTLDASGNLGVGCTSLVGSGSISIKGGQSLQWQAAGSSTVYGDIYTDTSNNMVFRNGSSPTERARIDSSGNLLVGKTADSSSTAGGQINSNGFAVFTRSGGNPLGLNRLTSTGTVVDIQYASSTVGSISYNGTLTLYNQTSDQRLKENILDAETAISTLNQIQIRSFDWKESKVHETHGVIAQELYQIVPQCVTEGENNEDGSIKTPWQVDTSPLVPMLIKAIQELNAKVDAQAAEIAALKG